MTAQENLLSKAPSGCERHRVDAAVLEPGNLFLLPRLALASYPTKPSSPEISYSQFVAARGGPMGQVTPGRIERAAEKPSRASKVIGLKGF